MPENNFDEAGNLSQSANNQSTLRFDLLVKFFNKFGAVKGR